MKFSVCSISGLKKIFLIFAFFINTGLLFAQTKFVQKLEWKGDPNVLEYKVEIQNKAGQIISSVITEEYQVELSLVPGSYKYKITAYDLLGREAQTTSWIPFEIFKANQPAIVHNQNLEALEEDGSTLILSVNIMDVTSGTKAELISSDNKTIIQGSLVLASGQVWTGSGGGSEIQTAVAAKFTNVTEGNWKLLITNPSGLYSESLPFEVKDVVKEERLAAAKAEEERIAREKAEAERLAKEEAEKLEREETERLAREEEERLAKEEEERLAREEAERLAKEEAERANNAKTRFLTNMSHELLTPINTISGINEMTLREKAADVPLNYRAFIKSNALDIRSASESLRYLIGDLLDLAEIESGKIHTVISEYDTVDILREIISMTKMQCDDKGLDLITEVDELLPMRMEGDIGKIKQIVLNLLTNSVKYTRRGSVTLLISVEEKTDDECTLRFTVKDTGAGMDDKIMSSLFSVYSRIGELGEQEEMSTGLGLDISSRFAKVMGGSLTAESEVGKGTTFVFTLRQKMIDDRPIGAFAAVTEKMSPDEYVPLFRSPDADLLLVSNDAMTIKVVKGLLKATDVFVTTASNIEECMDIVHAKKINIVLFDMILQTEKDNIPKLLKYDPDLPIYALVSYAAEDNEHYANMGFRGVISKPVDGIMLERTVMRHLDEDMMEKNEDLYSRR